MATCRKCDVIMTYENTAKSFLERNFRICRSCDNREKTEYIRRLRIQIMNRFGHKCECCGINEFNYLSIDHINGGGIKDRHRYKRWKNYLKYLVDLPLEELNKNYRCLCFNCNCAMGFYGVCPHKLDYSKTQLDMDPSNRGIKKISLSVEEKRLRKAKLKQIANIKVKLEMIKAYGGECVDCGESCPLFLVLDHVKNNGNLEKLAGKEFYQFLKRRGYPGKNTELQLLCNNCNSKKEYADSRFEKRESALTVEGRYPVQIYNISEQEMDQLWAQARNWFALLENHR